MGNDEIRYFEQCDSEFTETRQSIIIQLDEYSGEAVDVPWRGFTWAHLCNTL